MRKRFKRNKPCAVCGVLFPPAGAAITCGPECSAERKRQRERAWFAANPERKRAQSRGWAKRNPEKARASERAWYAANREKVEQKARARYAAKLKKRAAIECVVCGELFKPRTCTNTCGLVCRAERRKAHNSSKYARAYYAANREKIKERGRSYYAANREQCIARSLAYYARKKSKRGVDNRAAPL